MIRARFCVSYEIVTPESAEEGEADERGFICERERLRDALKDLHRTRTNLCDSGQGLDTSGEYLTVYNGVEFETGAHENRTLHIPRSVTRSSWRRIARLAGANL